MKRQECEQLTLFQEDSPASRSALPGSEEARKMTVTSGLKCLELYQNSGPLGSLVRMLLGSSIWRSTRCTLTWKTKVTPCKRLLFRLVPSTRRTGGTDARLLPTVTAQDYKHRGPNSRQQGLPEYVRMWPTPKAQNARGRRERHGNGGPSLDVVAMMYPTPTTGAGLCGGTGNFRQLKKLEEAGQITEEERRNMSQGNGGQLNPTFVEWLMGFPLGWTDLNAWGTP